MSIETGVSLPLAWCRSTENGTQQKYAEFHAAHVTDEEKPCVFCEPDHGEILEEGDGIYVLENRYPYELWDRFDVKHQALIIPKIHTESLRELPSDVRYEWIDMVMKYEDRGYSNYTRDPSNPSKSQPHYHTHVIALGGRALVTQHYDVRTYSNQISFHD